MARKGYAGGKLASQAVAKKGDHLLPPPGASAEFVRLWDMTVKDFDPEYFHESDRIVLETYIDLSLTMRMMQEELKGQPLMLDSPQGVKENPLLGSITRLAGKVSQYARTLRLTPTSRVQTNSQPTRSKLKEEAAPDKVGGIRLVA